MATKTYEKNKSFFDWQDNAMRRLGVAGSMYETPLRLGLKKPRPGRDTFHAGMQELREHKLVWLTQEGRCRIWAIRRAGRDRLGIPPLTF